MDKLPPHNNEAEDAIIASIIIDAELVLPQIIAIIEPGDFLQDKARICYEAILELRKRNSAIDQITVWNELERIGKLNQVGRSYLSFSIAALPTPYHCKAYAGIVADCAERRRMIQQAGQMAGAAYDRTRKPKSSQQPEQPRWGVVRG